MGVKKKLGLNIKAIRKSLGLSQEKFAEKINISRHSLSAIETGKNFASDNTLDNIYKNLKIDYNDLFTFENKSDNLLSSINVKLKMLNKDKQKMVKNIIDAMLKEE